MSSDPYLERITINPRYLENNLDRLAQAAASRLARDLLQDHTMHELVLKEIGGPQ